MEEYSEMNGQNDEQNTGGEFGGSYYQHNAMPREKKSGQNSCAGYILVGILCLLVGIAVGSCTTTLAISGIKEAAESVLPGEDKGSGDNDDSEGYIVTNAHVIKGASKVTVTLPDNDKQEIDAEVVGYDSTMDIAVLYIRKDGLKPLALGSAENVRVGDFTIAIGNPSGSELAGTATFGIISATSRNVNIDGHENEYLQTDAAINPGNSGGPLLNMKGEVIGITTAKNIFAGYDEYGNTISAEGLGFAIPIDKAVEVVEELITQGHVARPGIGVNVIEITEENAEEYDLHPGILIYSVTKNGPAHKAGLKVDDIVTAYDGINVTTQGDFVDYIKDKRVGDTVSLEIIRGDEKITIDVTLGDINELGDELVGNRTSSLFD